MTLSASPSTGSNWRTADSIFDYDWEDPAPYVDPDTPDTDRFNSLYPEWHKQASCLGSSDDLFFGESEPTIRPQYSISTIREAKTLCSMCPVKEACLLSALVKREEYGVWAGSTRTQRKAILKQIALGQTTLEQAVAVFMEELCQ